MHKITPAVNNWDWGIYSCFGYQQVFNRYKSVLIILSLGVNFICASSKSELNLTDNVANAAVPQKPRQFTVSQLQQWLSRLNLQCNRWAVNHRAVGPSHGGNILSLWGQVEAGSLADNRRVQQSFYSAAQYKVDQLSSGNQHHVDLPCS